MRQVRVGQTGVKARVVYARGLMIIVAGLCLGPWAAPGAQAEDGGLSPGYGPDTLTFETWCREIRGIEPARCLRREAADLAAYRTTLVRMQAFESEHQAEIRKEREFNEWFNSRGQANPSDW